VSPAATSTLTLVGLPASTTAGTALVLTVRAMDAYGNATPGYAGTVRFTSNDSRAVLPADYTFTAGDAGQHAFAVTLETAAAIEVRARDAAHATLTGAGGPAAVAAAAPAVVTLTYPSTAQAGTAQSLVVSIHDAYENLVTGYTGTLHFTTSDLQASSLLPDYAFTTSDDGTHVFAGVVLKTAGVQSITATDTAHSGFSGKRGGILVTPAGAQLLVIAGFPTATTAGVAQGFLVTVTDPFHNTVPTYTGTVHFTSNASNAVLPADYAFIAADAGTHVFAATLLTAGTGRLIRVTDAAHGSITGLTPSVTVTPAAANRLVVSGYPASAKIGVVNTFTVMLFDAYGNIATGYTGTLNFMSDDPFAVFVPSTYTFTSSDAGQHTFYAVFKTAGKHYLKATDTTDASLTGSETGIIVT
jgi:hypothetical protein